MTAEWANDGRWGDLNHDGRLDLVTIGATVLRVFLNTGSGFTNAYTLTLQAGWNAAVAVFNQDGNADIYVVQGRPNNRGPNPARLVAARGRRWVRLRFFRRVATDHHRRWQRRLAAESLQRPASTDNHERRRRDLQLHGPRQQIEFTG